MSIRWGLLLGPVLFAVMWLPYSRRDQAAGWVMHRLEARFPRAPECEIARAAGIVVLGGGLAKFTERGGLPSDPVHERLTRAAVLAKQFPNLRVVYSGYEGSEDPLSVLDNLGVNWTRITWESRSRNTIENAAFSYDLIRPRADEWWGLVTSAFHMPRAVGLFRGTGFNVIPVPVGYLRDLHYQDSIDHAWHETFGLLFNRASGRSSVILPRQRPSAACLQT